MVVRRLPSLTARLCFSVLVEGKSFRLRIRSFASLMVACLLLAFCLPSACLLLARSLSRKRKPKQRQVAALRGLADEHIRNWQPFNKEWPTIEGAVYLRLSDDTQVAVERGPLEQQIHIAISEAVYRSEQERMNYRITEFYIEPGITGASTLGFDAVRNEHGEYTGSYTPNKKELKQVEWIMASFLNVDRYNVLLERCKEKNIKTKRGCNFTRSSLRTLLTNPRYIGKWYRNKRNEGKRQNKLMPYERFAEVKLEHGCVIDEGLWQRVQDKVKELDKSRAQATKGCYPLTGLLVFSDGSRFTGSSAWGRTQKSTYYHNKANKIRVQAEAFDTEAEKILRQVAENAPEFQKSIADYSARKDSTIDLVKGKVTEIDTKLGELEDERQRLDRRLNFLLEDDDLEMARSFRDEYKERVSAMKDEERELISKKKQLRRLLHRSLPSSLHALRHIRCANEWQKHTHKAINYVKKKDWLSLKSTYRQLFKKIIVQPLDGERVQLEFVFNNTSSPENSGEDTFCVYAGRAEQIHRATKSVSNQQLSMRSGAYKTSPIIPESVIKRKYLENRLSTRAIASEFSCSKTYVRSLLLKYNIPLRQTPDYRGSRWSAYGKRRVGGRTVDHKAELRTIDTIRTMYAEGISTNAIARYLNTMKIPTKQQGKGWHNCTVAEILKREGVYISGKVLV